MNLFDQLVSQAMKNHGELSPLKIVVEKELLHHDILREMSEAGLLENLTFIGGTCLRSCYGSKRLSEDLDFTGGHNFKRTMLNNLSDVLISRLYKKYGLHITISKPIKETGNADTWKLKITTRPEQKNLPLQRINIDICAIPSYDRRPVLLRNHYNVDMGTSGLIVLAQSRQEILADKFIALALRPNRIKNRDLWDISWLKQQNIDVPVDLVAKKIKDHKCDIQKFIALLGDRQKALANKPEANSDFTWEMKRFLPPQIISTTIENKAFWEYLINLVHTECDHIIHILTKT
ncbi:nucleotidyl transferase AbiEii/AbiGii toxin family protein [Desulfobacula sp.]|uniref:nucleotidyl transferase AbiEii/AbiGii toxin family protein n=1 Tax=Desulfobacula sp. TaxID=2593537 RepID=UPI0025BE8239|nr:nucleotidyl transferase AbiEii/AbiGii toxin family protein [Desulfobacula sp.]MBC2705896.1 nucleotidyl transferase AbiEii/AbiGii toxin family protein [Desulfobacula sp.]